MEFPNINIRWEDLHRFYALICAPILNRYKKMFANLDEHQSKSAKFDDEDSKVLSTLTWQRWSWRICNEFSGSMKQPFDKTY